MTFRRCPKCRTLCDAERETRCFACGTALAAATPLRPLPMPDVRGEARRDLSVSLSVFACIGILGSVGLCLNLGKGGLPALLLLGTLVAAVIVTTVIVPRGTAPEVTAAGKVILGLFAAIGVIVLILLAVAVGLVILIAIICARSGSR